MTWRIRLLALAGIAVLVVSPWPHLTPDGVNYLSIARSVATSGELTRLGESQVFHGPGYPVAIAPLFWLSGEPWLLLSIVNALLLASFGMLAYRCVRDNTPDAAGYVAALSVVNVITAMIFRRPLSETIFCSGLYALAIGYNRVLAGNFPSWQWPILIAGQCGLALVRQLGAVAGAGVALAVLAQAMRGERRWTSALGIGLLTSLPSVGVVAAWTHYDNARATEFSNADFLASQTSSQSLADWPLNPLHRRLAEGLRVRIAEAGQVTLPGLFKSYADDEDWVDVNTFIYLPYFAALLIGWRRLLRTGDVMAWIWPLYFLAHVYWPFNQSARFTVPMAPVLFVFLWRALDRWPTRRGPFFVALIALHFAVSIGVTVSSDAPKARNLSLRWELIRNAANSIRRSDQQVALSSDDADLQLPLQFLLDRPVPVIREDSPTGLGRDIYQWSDSDRRQITIRDR